jgi:sugar phosphate isomerase/epimerase
MKVALFTGVFRNEPFELTARLAAELGYDGLELRALSHLKPDYSLDQVKEVKRIADFYGLPIPVIYSNVTGNYEKVSDREAEEKLDLLKKYTEWANVLESGMVFHVPGGPAPDQASEADYDRAAYWLARAADIMAQGNARLVMEMHHRGLVETVDSTLKLIGKVGRDNVGAILDPGNMANAGEEYGANAVARLGKHIFHVHAKDIRYYQSKQENPKAKEYHGRYHSVVLMGEGDVDHTPAYQALLAAGYDGYVSLEAQVDGVTPEHIAAHEVRAYREAIEQCRKEGGGVR